MAMNKSNDHSHYTSNCAQKPKRLTKAYNQKSRLCKQDKQTLIDSREEMGLLKQHPTQEFEKMTNKAHRGITKILHE